MRENASSRSADFRIAQRAIRATFTHKAKPRVLPRAYPVIFPCPGEWGFIHQGKGWGWGGLGTRRPHPIPLPASPLKGEGEILNAFTGGAYRSYIPVLPRNQGLLS